MTRRWLAGWLAAILLIGGGCAAAPRAEKPAVSSSSSPSLTVTAATKSTATAVATTALISTGQTVTLTTARPTQSPTPPTTATSATRSSRTTTAKTAVKTTRRATTSAPAAAITVTLTVDCEEAVAYGNAVAKAVAPNGVILSPVSVTLEPDATVWDALQKCGLVVSSHQTAMGVYVSAIQSLAEKACGGKSGWIYTVNGNAPSRSCDRQILRDGDVVEWHYTVTGEPR
ncbi:MAG: DUF4430 domain-containing protein [Acutalibacteraceae bacterium]|jgi:hypothetical protein